MTTMVDNGDGTVTISWENQSKGVHGGYVDKDKLGNIVYEFSNGLTGDTPVPCIMDARDTVSVMRPGEQMAYIENGNSYTFSENLQGVPGWIVKGVSAMAHRQPGEEPQDTIDENSIPIIQKGGVIADSTEILANKFAMIDDQLVEGETSMAFLITGTPASLPMRESFANKQVTTSEFWWWRQLEGNTTWTLVNDDTDGD